MIEDPEHFAFSWEENDEVSMVAYAKGKKIYILRTEDEKQLNEFTEVDFEI